SPQAFFAQASDIRPSDESLVAFALAKDRENELVRERERSRTANARIAELEERLRVNEETLDAVLNSRGWRLLNRLREFRDRFPGLSSVWRVKHNYLYQTWIQLRERRIAPDQAQVDIAQFQYKPSLSILMPVYNTPSKYLEKAIASVRAQYYPNWEFCICDDGGRQPEIRQILESAASTDARVQVIFSDKNEG